MRAARTRTGGQAFRTAITDSPCGRPAGIGRAAALNRSRSLSRTRPVRAGVYQGRTRPTLSLQQAKPEKAHTVAPLLADPLARATVGTGTTVMQLREAIAEALYPVKSYDLPDVCRAFGLAEGSGDEAYASKRSHVRSRIQGYTEDQLFELGSRVVEARYLPEPGRGRGGDGRCRCSAWRVVCAGLEVEVLCLVLRRAAAGGPAASVTVCGGPRLRPPPSGSEALRPDRQG